MNKSNFIRLWGMPALLAILSIYGLIAALAGDGIWDISSWFALGIPVWIAIRYYFFQKKRS